MGRNSRSHRKTRRRPPVVPSSGRSGGGPGARMRAEVAQVAARLMAEECIHDFAEAKSRAAERLGADGRNALPRNEEVEAELRTYQALFQADAQPRWLLAKRQAALEVMRLLASFDPRLTGSVLRGTAVEDAEITLHVFADTPETIARFLIDRGIPWELDAAWVRFGPGRERELPVYRFGADGQSVRLVVFPADGPRIAPRSPVDGRPMARAAAPELADMLAAEDA